MTSALVKCCEKNTKGKLVLYPKHDSSMDINTRNRFWIRGARLIKEMNNEEMDIFLRDHLALYQNPELPCHPDIFLFTPQFPRIEYDRLFNTEGSYLELRPGTIKMSDYFRYQYMIVSHDFLMYDYTQYEYRCRYNQKTMSRFWQNSRSFWIHGVPRGFCEPRPAKLQRYIKYCVQEFLENPEMPRRGHVYRQTQIQRHETSFLQGLHLRGGVTVNAFLVSDIPLENMQEIDLREVVAYLERLVFETHEGREEFPRTFPLPFPKRVDKWSEYVKKLQHTVDDYLVLFPWLYIPIDERPRCKLTKSEEDFVRRHAHSSVICLSNGFSSINNNTDSVRAGHFEFTFYQYKNGHKTREIYYNASASDAACLSFAFVRILHILQQTRLIDVNKSLITPNNLTQSAIARYILNDNIDREPNFQGQEVRKFLQTCYRWAGGLMSLEDIVISGEYLQVDYMLVVLEKLGVHQVAHIGDRAHEINEEDLKKNFTMSLPTSILPGYKINYAALRDTMARSIAQYAEKVDLTFEQAANKFGLPKLEENMLWLDLLDTALDILDLRKFSSNQGAITFQGNQYKISNDNHVKPLLADVMKKLQTNLENVYKPNEVLI